MKITVDLETMTLGELERFEEIAGVTIEEFAKGKSSTKATLALITIQEQRRDPHYTVDDARKIKLADIEVEEPAGPPTRKRKAAS